MIHIIDLTKWDKAMLLLFITTPISPLSNIEQLERMETEKDRRGSRVVSRLKSMLLHLVLLNKYRLYGPAY